MCVCVCVCLLILIETVVFLYDPDLECIFTVICNIVTKSQSADEALEMAKLISGKITQQPNDKPALRLKM